MARSSREIAKMRTDRMLAGVGVLALALGSCAVYEEPPPAGGGQEKVAVCHKGKKTLWVAEPAVRAHLGHGDRRGPCR